MFINPRLILFLIFWFCSAYLHSQVTLTARINSGNSTTTCDDLPFGGPPEPHYAVSVDGQPYETYPQLGVCFANPPNIQFTQVYSCQSAYPANLNICLQAFEDDGAACIPSQSCLEQICQNFATPTPGSALSYNLNVGGASTAAINFTITATGSFSGQGNDLICNAIDLGTLPYGGSVGNNAISNYDNFCATNTSDPTPWGATNEQGVWFQFTTGTMVGNLININAASDPGSAGDAIDLQLALYKSSNGACNGVLTLIDEDYDGLGLLYDEEMDVNCLSPNTTYFLLVDGEEMLLTPGGQEGYFGLEITDNGISTTRTYVDQNATGLNNGTSWTNAFTDLQPALDCANPGDTIWVAQGTYLPTEEPDGVAIGPKFRSFHIANKDVKVYGGFDGTETMLSQRNWQTNTTILNGDFNNDDVITGGGATLSINNNSDNSVHVFIALGLSTNSTIDGFTISGGNAFTSGTFVYESEPISLANGGGLYAANSHVLLNNLLFTHNVAGNLLGGPGYGGGVYTDSSNLEMDNISFVANHANNGGGMFTNFSSPVLNNVHFEGNRALFNGAGLDNSRSSPTVSNATFINNFATNGGGMLNFNCLPSSSFTDIVFSENEAASGGGMYNLGSDVNISNVVFAENHSSNQGGGMYNTTSSPNIINVSFSANSATTTGGGIHNTNSSAPTLTNTLFFGNTSPDQNDIFNSSSTPTVEYSAFEDYTFGAAPGCFYLTASPFANTSDPDGVDNIWMTADDGLNLALGSPCGGAGTATGAPALDITGTTRLNPPSIGAYEGSPCTPTSSTDTQTACDSLNWIDGNTYYANNNTATHTLTNAAGCDSVITLNLTINNTASGAQSVVACDSTQIGSTWYFNSTIFNDTLVAAAANGCDSIVTYNVLINNSVATDDTINACDSALVNGTWYFSSQSLVDNNTTVASCDSIHTRYIVISPSINTNASLTACDSSLINNTWYFISQIVMDTFLAVSNCDSIHTVNLTINNSSAPTVVNNTTCNPSMVGTVIDTFPNTSACDSIVTTNTTLIPNATATQSVVACDSALIGTNWYFISTIFNDTIIGGAANSCDSIVTYNVLINNSVATDDSITACDSTQINGTWYTATQAIVFNDTTALGCDSTHTTYLTINQSSNFVDVRVSCDSLFWIDGNTYTSSNNTATITLTNATGCDSIISLDLTINPSYTVIDTQVACGSYTWIDGNTYNSSNNTATFNIPSVHGCDSIITLNLTLNNPSLVDDVITVCDSMTWINGVTYYNSTNTPTVNLTNSVGCDSIITLDLTVLYTNITNDVQVACDSLTWIDGITYTTSTNTPSFTLTNALGCDSIVTLSLTINNSNYGTDVITACDSVTWLDGITYTSANNTATFTTTNNMGCDSVITLNFSITPPTTGVDNIVNCGPYTWIDGITYNGSNNTATYTQTGSNGCDSITTLNLTINNPSATTDVVTACGLYQWIDGNIYAASNNTATHVLTNAVGCDSVVTLDLTLNNLNTGIDTVVACDQYTWVDGITYTGSNNTASFTYTNGGANGCDSTVFLDLTLNSAQGHTYVLTECDSYTWVNGVTYTSSIIGESYVVPRAAANGCDSLYFLDLEIIPSGSGTDIVTACGSYTWIDGITYSSNNNTATYTVPGGNPNGCDILMTLDLSIDSVPTISITSSNGVLSATPGLSNYQWYRNGQVIPGATSQTYTPTSWGLHTCSTNDGLCDGSSNGITIALTGINDSEFGFVGIYPNPITDIMRIDVGNEKLNSIQLIDVSGKVVTTLPADRRAFYLGDYASGLYFVELMNENKRSMIKIVLK